MISIPLVPRDVEYRVSAADVAEWSEAYPAVDIIQSLRNIRQWCLSNPKRRKTRRGARKFVTGWLAREQDRGRPVARGGPFAHRPAAEIETRPRPQIVTAPPDWRPADD